MSSTIRKSTGKEVHEAVQLFDMLEGNDRHRRNTPMMIILRELREEPKEFPRLAKTLRREKRLDSSSVWVLMKKLESAGMVEEANSGGTSVERLTREGRKLARAL